MLVIVYEVFALYVIFQNIILRSTILGNPMTRESQVVSTGEYNVAYTGESDEANTWKSKDTNMQQSKDNYTRVSKEFYVVKSKNVDTRKQEKHIFGF